ncbi:MAG: riboflavin biosynthesis protein RibF [Acidobacteriota bacterium]|nr:riboflavin biosynthesis protein RibF [Acidobacteriota bacterium]
MSVEVFRSLEESRGRFGPCALAIGNFDGVHIGHQALIKQVVSFAQSHALTPAVLTFDPHPTSVVAPHRVPLLLCPVSERLQLLGMAGIERVSVLNFTAQTAKLSPEEFVKQILLDALYTRAVFVGENFRFGYKQGGTPEILRALGDVHGFSSFFLEPVTFRGRVVSSTTIRTELMEGDVAKAGRLLNRSFSISGPVVSGRGIGSKQTVPTLNLCPDPKLLVPRGIFVTETLEPATGRRWPSVTSCGYNPTFGATELTIETYLLEELKGASPREITARFRHFLRQEQTYPDAATLRVQIMKDVARAEAYWRHADRLGKVPRFDILNMPKDPTFH